MSSQFKVGDIIRIKQHLYHNYDDKSREIGTIHTVKRVRFCSSDSDTGRNILSIENDYGVYEGDCELAKVTNWRLETDGN